MKDVNGNTEQVIQALQGMISDKTGNSATGAAHLRALIFDEAADQVVDYKVPNARKMFDPELNISLMRAAQLPPDMRGRAEMRTIARHLQRRLVHGRRVVGRRPRGLARGRVARPRRLGGGLRGQGPGGAAGRRRRGHRRQRRGARARLEQVAPRRLRRRARELRQDRRQGEPRDQLPQDQEARQGLAEEATGIVVDRA